MVSGTCIYKPCNDLEWWDGEKCQFVYNGSGCDGDNVRRWYNLTGGITCDCEYGWARQTSQGECHQYSTQAWCPEGQLLQVKGPYMQFIIFVIAQLYHQINCTVYQNITNYLFNKPSSSIDFLCQLTFFINELSLPTNFLHQLSFYLNQVYS